MTPQKNPALIVLIYLQISKLAELGHACTFYTCTLSHIIYLKQMHNLCIFYCLFIPVLSLEILLLRGRGLWSHYTVYPCHILMPVFNGLSWEVVVRFCYLVILVLPCNRWHDQSPFKLSFHNTSKKIVSKLENTYQTSQTCPCKSLLLSSRWT